jgi:hypothetical protein
MLLLASGCSSPRQAAVTLDVRTDYAAPGEFDRVEFRFVGPTGARGERAVRSGDDFAGGVRVVDLPGLSAGDYQVEVSLRRGESRIATRRVSLRLRSEEPVYALLVLFTRSCEGIVCPPESDPEATECEGRTCIRPDCSLVGESREECFARECRVAEDCPAVADCATRECVRGSCLPRAPECAPGIRCDLVLGCVGGPADLGVDAGGSATDGGDLDLGSATGDAGEGDAGVADLGFDMGEPVDLGVDMGGPVDLGTDLGTDLGMAGARDSGVDLGRDLGTDLGRDSGPACTPVAETCNGLDDDCDGIVDDGACLWQWDDASFLWRRRALDMSSTWAPSGPVRAAAGIGLANDVLVFTDTHVHFLDLPTATWEYAEPLSVRFGALAGRRITAASSVDGVSEIFEGGPERPHVDLFLIVGTRTVIYRYRSGPFGTEGSSTSGSFTSLPEADESATMPSGPAAPDYRETKARWYSPGNASGFAPGDPRILCDNRTYPPRVTSHVVHVSPTGQVSIAIAMYPCGFYYERMPVASFGMFTRPGAPDFRAWQTAAWANESLWVLP